MLKSERYKLPLPRPKRAPAVREDTTLTTPSTDFATTILNDIDKYWTLPTLTLDALTIAQDSLAFALHSQDSFVLIGPEQVINLTTIFIENAI